MSAQENERLHQLLCAWILGEASESETAEVERALAASPELRAEKERLEGTISLVNDAYAGDAELSEDALAELLRAAETGAGANGPALRAVSTARLRWVHAPVLRAAAAVTAMLGGVFALVQYSGQGSGDEYVDTVAHAPAAPAETRPLEETLQAEVLLDAELDGRVSGDASTRHVWSDLERDSLVRVEVPEKDGAASLADAPVDAAPLRQNEAALALESAQEALGELEEATRADEGAVGKIQDGLALQEQQQVLDRFGKEHAADQESLRGLSELEDLAGALTERLAREQARAESLGAARVRMVDKGDKAGEAGVLTGSDDFFLGRGERETEPEVALRSSESTVEESRKKLSAREKLAKGEASDLGFAGGKEVEGKRGVPQAGGDRRGAGGGYGRFGEELHFDGGSGGGGGPSKPGPAAPGAAASGPSTPGPAGPSTPAPESKNKPAPAEGEVAAGLSTRARRAGEPVSGVVGNDPVGGEREIDRLLALGYLGDADEDDTTRGLYYEDSGRRAITRDLSDAELERLARLLAERRFQECRRRPQETPRDMFFRYWGDNPFEETHRDAQSTFSVDVDTASYALARRYLNEGHLPTKAQVRTEEFLNYFDPDLPAPLEGTFAVSTELAPSLFGGRADRWMLRVGVRGKEVAAEERSPVALTFVVDTSGSMKENQRLELVKHAMRLLVAQLDARDSIAIIAYSNEARLVLPMTSAAQRGVIEAALHPLSPNGSTNAEGGLKLGYEVALAALAPGVHNRVVLLSDGVANVGQTDQDRINEDVARHRASGVYLNTIGVGMNNHNDVFLEQLANKGDGICDYVDSAEAARRAIVERFTGALIPIASDVKVQVEFDATQVARYRLLGYENRAIADADFRNDAVDAGEVGAGHQVVALYEIERTGAEPAGPLATVRLRWKEPKAPQLHTLEQTVTEVESSVNASDALASYATASAGYRRSVLVAQFAELLRRSVHGSGDSMEVLVNEATTLASELRDPDFDEFAGLVRKAIGLGLPYALYGKTELEMTIDEYKRFLYLRAQFEQLEKQSDLEDLRKQNDDLEQKIRDLIHADLKQRK